MTSPDASQPRAVADLPCLCCAVGLARLGLAPVNCSMLAHSRRPRYFSATIEKFITSWKTVKITPR